MFLARTPFDRDPFLIDDDDLFGYGKFARNKV